MNHLAEVTKEVNQFREKMNWKEYYKSHPKDTAMSIVSEAVEVLDYFRYKKS